MRKYLRSFLLATTTLLLTAQTPGQKPAAGPPESLDARLGAEAWPEGQTFVEGKTLTFNTQTPKYDREWTEINSQRILILVVKPGEKLNFRLKAEDSKVALRAHVPEPPPPMKWRLALQNANRLPWQARTTRLSIKNECSDPQTLFLIIYGAHGNAYRVDLERK